VLIGRLWQPWIGRLWQPWINLLIGRLRARLGFSIDTFHADRGPHAI